MNDHAHHDNHHRLKEDRRVAHEAQRSRTGVEKLRKRETAKRYFWTLKGHLACCHAIRVGPFAQLSELEARHRQAHAAP